jgi:hypothetical protein
MTPHDQQRFAKLVSEFIEGSGLYPPLYLVGADRDRGGAGRDDAVRALPASWRSPAWLVVALADKEFRVK